MTQEQAVLYQVTKMFSWQEPEAKERLFDGDVLKEDYADIILEADRERMLNQKAKQTKSHDDGFKEAEKKFKSFAEETFKTLTGYTGTETNFEEMFKSWQETEKKKWQKNIEVNEDTVKKHPAYIALETERIPKTEYETLKSEYEQYKSTEERNRVMGVVSNSAWDLVASERPIIEKNETVAANRRRDFLSKLGGYDYDLQGREPLVLTKEGKRIEDEHGNPVSYKTFILDLASQYFEFEAQTSKETVTHKTGETTVTVITEKPVTKGEYYAALDRYSAETPENAKMRIALKAYYHEHKKD